MNDNENEEFPLTTGVLWLLVCAFFLGMLVYGHYRDSRDEYERTIRGLRRDNLDLSTRVYLLEHPEQAETFREQLKREVVNQ